MKRFDSPHVPSYLPTTRTPVHTCLAEYRCAWHVHTCYHAILLHTCPNYARNILNLCGNVHHSGLVNSTRTTSFCNRAGCQGTCSSRSPRTCSTAQPSYSNNGAVTLTYTEFFFSQATSSGGKSRNSSSQRFEQITNFTR